MDPQTSQAAEAVYRSLTAFAATHIDSVAELEILPSSYPLASPNEPVLQDGHCLAIRKRDLAAAYMVAHQPFFSRSTRRPVDEDEDDSILLDTFVLIFFAPEHLTAVNWRKRLLVRRIGEVAGRSAHEAATLLRRELRMLDTFCTSPLPKHPKSPTLWQHRYWVISTFMTRVPGWMPAFSDELRIVLQAADKHFANYTAFDYARRLWLLLSHAIGTHADGDANVLDAGLHSTEVVRLVQKFCFTHPRDISGWTFLAFILRDQSSPKETTREATKVFVCDTGCSGKAIDRFFQAIDAPPT